MIVSPASVTRKVPKKGLQNYQISPTPPNNIDEKAENFQMQYSLTLFKGVVTLVNKFLCTFACKLC